MAKKKAIPYGSLGGKKKLKKKLKKKAKMKKKKQKNLRIYIQMKFFQTLGKLPCILATIQYFATECSH